MVKMNSIAAENYHLKWDSHLSYLNLSLNSLYKNEKYADVMLLTSHSDGGPPIPAHRIILSSCSHYFASIFEGISYATNNITCIVLPPELSRKAIQILVQYMYAGEATVSNDILTEVLRGGEILKIRGLCRNHGGRDNHFHHNEPKTNNQVTVQSCISHSDSTSDDLDLRGLSSSAAVIPKESPVIVMTPKIQSTPPAAAPLGPLLSTPNITVNKEYAIDPDETLKTSSFCAMTSHLSRIAKKLHVNHGSPVQAFPSSSQDLIYTKERERFRRHSEDALLSSRTSDMCRDEVLNMSRRVSPDQENMDRALHRSASIREGRNHHIENEVFRKDHPLFSTECPLEDSLSETLDLLPIKEEPSEWVGEHGSDCVSSSSKRLPLDMVKVETNLSDEEGKAEVENGTSQVYSPLTCELCSETFTQPADWVRHIESHMDSPTKYIPKKRKRVASSSTELIASLKCDLCDTQYETPAEWVRHIQSTHTETELAISNNSELPKSRRSFCDRFIVKDSNKCTSRQRCISPDFSRTVPPKKTKQTTPEYHTFLEKTCDVCNKDFSSYANMILHRKTHSTNMFQK